MINPLTSTLLSSISHVQHGFFTREGGISEGYYASLNCSAQKNDPLQNVQENRHRIVKMLRGEKWIGLDQKHTNTPHFVTAAWDDNSIIGDALVTTTQGLVLSVVTADCVPIILTDAKRSVIGVIHAGWQGAFSGIIENTLNLMGEKGANTIVAAIGPSIQQRFYEVGPEFKDHFNTNTWLSKHAKFDMFFEKSPKDHHFFFNLQKLTHYILEKNGVEHIHNINIDTYSDEKRFFSHRRQTHKNEPERGCQASCIVLTRNA